MVKVSNLLVLIYCITLFAATSPDVNLSGTVKDAGGAAVAGAKVCLVKLPFCTTSAAQGEFTLKNPVAVTAPYAISIRNSPQVGIKGHEVQFTISSEVNNGSIEILSTNGRRSAIVPLGKLQAGPHHQALPALSTGFYVMNITLDGSTTTLKLVNTSNGFFMNTTEMNAGLDRSITFAAAAQNVDTLVITKTGFETAKLGIELYSKSGIAVVLQPATAVVCTAPNLPASSGLTKENPKLPDPFTFYDGTKLTKKSQWECRRQEILAMAQKYVYGPCPPKPDEVTGTVSGGTVTINCKQGSKTATFTAKISGSGDAICLKLSGGIYPSSAKTLDIGSGNASKIQSLYGVSGMIENLANAWMIDRVMDVLELNPSSGHDPKKMMVSGCSGCGKGAFLAGVFSRIPLTVIVESGGGGAANFRQAEWFRHGGGSSSYKCADAKPQSIDNLEDNGICGPWVSSVAQWLRSSPAKVKNLPYDQHSLLACIAPRYLCHVTNQHGQNEWCHLGGTCEALSAWAAKPVFKALGIPENMGFIVYTEGSAPGHCSNPSSATTLANAFFNRVFKGDASAKTDVWTANDKDLQQPVGDWKAMWVDWDMDTKLE